MHNNKELHLTCSCHGHQLHFERDDNPTMWFVSFWQRGMGSMRSLRWTLQQMWQLLKTGHPYYNDDVILDKEHLEELQVYIQEQLDQLKNST
jgi:hypothetical protein